MYYANDCPSVSGAGGTETGEVLLHQSTSRAHAPQSRVQVLQVLQVLRTQESSTTKQLSCNGALEPIRVLLRPWRCWEISYYCLAMIASFVAERRRDANRRHKTCQWSRQDLDFLVYPRCLDLAYSTRSCIGLQLSETGSALLPVSDTDVCFLSLFPFSASQLSSSLCPDRFPCYHPEHNSSCESIGVSNVLEWC